MRHFTDEQKKLARKADLYAFLMAHHNADVKKEGDSLRLLSDNSVSVKQGYRGYKNFSDPDDHGNCIDFLVKKLGYQLDDAVFALTDDVSSVSIHSSEPVSSKKKITEKPKFPEPVDGPYRQLFANLKMRGISQSTIQMLIDRGLIYQEKKHNNIVFANKERNWGELRGTFTQSEKAFHGMIANARHNGCWWFKTNDEEETDAAYVCEAAIDAISLYELHQLNGKEGNYAYISIGGVEKQDTIDRIKRQIRTIIAVDNDPAGSKCRKRNLEVECIVPFHKDWNDDLKDVRSQQKDPDMKDESEPSDSVTTDTAKTAEERLRTEIPASNQMSEEAGKTVMDIYQSTENYLPEGYVDLLGHVEGHTEWVNHICMLRAKGII